MTNTNDLPELNTIPFSRTIFVDLETTGWATQIPATCVVSIGAVLMEKDGSISSKFYGVICPTEEQLSVASPEAFKVNGFSPEKLREEGRPASVVWKEFSDWLKTNKLTRTVMYVGQNPGFDLDFMQAEAPEIVAKYGWVPDRVIDNILLYGQCESKFIVPFISGPGKKKGKRGNDLAKALGVPGEPEVHNALAGAELNYRNFTRMAQLTQRWRLNNSK